MISTPDQSTCTCPNRLLTITSFLLSTAIILCASIIIAAIFYATKRIRNSRIDPVDKYNRRMTRFVVEMKALVEIGSASPAAETYDETWGVRDHILFALNHIDDIEEGDEPPWVRKDMTVDVWMVELIHGIDVDLESGGRD
ncbi:uncharacterized protein LY89DRAFT_668249 [Mollisia scopiformis]|uniref:Uncharacterized protein n=1 Tax=Mollisia scopiformis TaxID=149040 RepID=A0A194XD29_MOLSC|nr:uncharacterized protein LY89DRAFT_668249 [Mollisia scopiformis]KUJ18056.1 hypothetical protein LY89DRAFT_668249 [Mollisia scopiformis]